MRVEHVLGKWVTYIHDLDCSKVLSNQEEKKLYDLLADRAVICIKNQSLTHDDLIRIASIFGKVWDYKEDYGSRAFGVGHKQPEVDEEHSDNVEYVTEKGVLGNSYVPFHIDLNHYPIQYVPNRLLYCEANDTKEPCPTVFLNTIVGFSRLDEGIKKLLRRSTINLKAPYVGGRHATMKRPAVDWHPHHNKEYINIDGFTIDMDEYEGDFLSLRRTIYSQMEESNERYEHHYDVGDLLIYDNRGTTHYRPEFEGHRMLKRVSWHHDWSKYVNNS